MISENKKIAKNTIVVYINLFVSAVVGLYTSRLVLQALGVSDYGLYNVVGGVVALCAFFLASLSISTTRFLNLEMGKPDGNLNKVFNVCNVLHVVLALIVLLIAEILGVWYIVSNLNVEVERIPDALFVFHVSIIVSCIGITNVPYVSLFNANENFLFSAIVNIGQSLIKLFLVVWLMCYDGNKLRAYSLMVSFTTLVSFVVYHYYSYKYWPNTVKFKIVQEWHLYKEILTYNNYNFVATSALMIRSQGAALLINYFFGTIVNGAFAISRTIESYTLSFSANFDRAAVPQITQNYSRGDYERMTDLACKTGRYTIFLMILIAFPLYTEIETILYLWLGNVPEGATEFCKATLIVCFVGITGAGLSTVTDCNKIEFFKGIFSFLVYICVPLGYVMFKNGFPAYSLLIMFAIADATWRVLQLLFAKKLLNFDSLRYIKEAYLPAIKIGVILSMFIYISSTFSYETVIGHLARFLFVVFITASLLFLMGLNKKEKGKIITFILNKIR